RSRLTAHHMCPLAPWNAAPMDGDTQASFRHSCRTSICERRLPSVRESRTPPVVLLKALFEPTWTVMKASSWTDSIEKPDFSTLQSLAGDGAPVDIVTRETRP